MEDETSITWRLIMAVVAVIGGFILSVTFSTWIITFAPAEHPEKSIPPHTVIGMPPATPRLHIRNWQLWFSLSRALPCVMALSGCRAGMLSVGLLVIRLTSTFKQFLIEKGE